MKLKITSLLLIGLSTALVGCFSEDTLSSNTNQVDTGKMTIQGLSISDSNVANQDVTVKDADGKVVYQGQTDRLGAFTASADFKGVHFPLQVSIGAGANPLLQGQIQQSDLDSAHHVACTFKRDGMKKGEFDSRFAPRDPLREVAQTCQLPIPTPAVQAQIRSYLEAGQQVPDSLLPVLSAEQQSCVLAHVAPPTPGQLLAEKCNLPRPDSTTAEQIRSYVEKHQPVPASLLPVLSAEQKACIDSMGGPINPGPGPAPMDSGMVFGGPAPMDSGMNFQGPAPMDSLMMPPAPRH